MIKIAKFITGFDAVLIGLLTFVTYRYFEVQSLFYKYLPFDGWVRLIASCLVAVVVVFALLLFSSHIDRFKVSENDSGIWISWMMLAFTLFINAYFWEVWDADHATATNSSSSILVYSFKLVISLFFGAFDFAFNHLFISQWKENKSQKELCEKSAKLELELDELQQKELDIQLAIRQGEAKLSEILARDDPKVCPRCARNFDSPQQRNGHLRTCKKPI